jgi:N-acyl amino acid synthase of PEP-CTERM/exosortase system
MNDSSEVHFDAIRATDDTLWRQCVHLQREVYFSEREFETWTGKENLDTFDIYDNKQSERVAILANGEVIATSRVIFPGKYTLPALKLQPGLVEFIPNGKFVEVSSFACSKERRQRLGLLDAEASKTITSLLILATAAIAHHAGFENLAMAIEPALFRYFKHIDFNLTKIGKPVEYHGRRQVCFVRHFQQFAPQTISNIPICWNATKHNPTLHNFLVNPFAQTKRIA